jgi:hypothetical protein
METKSTKVLNIIEDLAKKLAVNYVDSSLDSFNVNENLNELINIYFNVDNIADIQKSRNVFILGAGASINGFPKIFKNGDSAVDYIEKELKFDKLKKNNPEIELKEKEITRKLLQGKKEKKASFETRLTILSHFYSITKIREEISKLFGYRTFPSHFHEILAHLFKNRFIDAIINFNFDETFDQALEEEIADGQLKKIISDGDCVPYSKLVNKNIIKIPLYIKPHGTFSEKSSLRFTKEQYIDIPSDIEKLMEDLFTGNFNESTKCYDFNELNLIICGFEMESIEFNDLISRVLNKYIERGNKQKLNMYFLQYDEESFYLKGNNQENDTNYEKLNTPEERLKKIFKSPNFNFFKIERKEYLEENSDSQIPFLDKFIIDLKDKCFYNFVNGPFSPRDTKRHDLLISLLDERIESEKVKEKPRYFNSPRYYLSRLIFEILIVVCKNNGIIQLEESLKNTNRIGIYYDYLMQFEMNEKTHLIDIILSQMGLKPRPISFGRGIYYIKIDMSKKEKKNAFNNCYSFVVDKVADNKILIGQDVININAIITELFRKIKSTKNDEYFMNLGDSINSNLYPNFSNINDHIFKGMKKENILCTDLAIYHAKINSLNKADTILLISDKGVIIKEFNEFIEKQKIKKYTVLSENHNIEKIDETEFSKIRQLPFYDHSRHLLLFLKDIGEENCPELISGIYFYKKGFSNNINAIYTEEKHNLEILYKTFLTYWMKAEYYACFGSLPYIKNADDIKKIYGIDNDSKTKNSSKLCMIEPKNENDNSDNQNNKFKVDERIKKFILKAYQEYLKL